MKAKNSINNIGISNFPFKKSVSNKMQINSSKINNEYEDKRNIQKFNSANNFDNAHSFKKEQKVYGKNIVSRSKLSHYITKLSAHRKKPVYYKLEKEIRRKFANDYNSTEKCNYRNRIIMNKHLSNTINVRNILPKNISFSNNPCVNIVKNYRPNWAAINLSSQKLMRHPNIVSLRNNHGVIIDWSKSKLYNDIANCTMGYKVTINKEVLKDFEIEYVLKRIPFVSDDEITVIHKKGINTFNKLINELSVEELSKALQIDFTTV